MPDPDDVDDGPSAGNKSAIPEGGASSLAQRDASGEVEEKDLSVGQRRRGGEDVNPE